MEGMTSEQAVEIFDAYAEKVIKSVDSIRDSINEILLHERKTVLLKYSKSESSIASNENEKIQRIKWTRAEIFDLLGNLERI
jgi:hypothetical protein